jgi:hypothetical protein
MSNARECRLGSYLSERLYRRADSLRGRIVSVRHGDQDISRITMIQPPIQSVLTTTDY